MSVATTARLSFGQPPSDTDSYPHAAEAWELHKMLIKRQISFPDEFRPQERDGVPGWRWRGSMRWAVMEKYPSAADSSRKKITEYLSDTDNAHSLGKRGPHATWWIRAEWNNVSPATVRRLRNEARGIPDPAFRRLAGQPHARAAAGMAGCRWCTQSFGHNRERLDHERKRHLAEYTAAAEFICPLRAGGKECGYPSTEPRPFGKHLAGEHGISDRAERLRVAGRARARAYAERSNDAAPAASPAAAAPALLPSIRIAEPGPETVTDTAPATAAAPEVDAGLSAGPAEPLTGADAPADDPGMAAAVAAAAGPDLAAVVNGRSGGVSAADALQAAGVVAAYLEAAAAAEDALRAERDAAAAERDELARQLDTLRTVFQPALDVLTAPVS